MPVWLLFLIKCWGPYAGDYERCTGIKCLLGKHENQLLIILDGGKKKDKFKQEAVLSANHLPRTV